jgi:hypothetical protein
VFATFLVPFFRVALLLDKLYHEMHFIPHHGINENESLLKLLKLKADNKCIESMQELKDWGGPTQCTMQRKKHQQPGIKNEMTEHEKSMHPHLGPHKIIILCRF